MLSFGMEYDFAFSIAFCSARFPAGSPPPSFAATMMARESFEKSLPRFASAAPFLCLMLDHLLCPDTDCSLHQLQEPLVNTRVVGQLRMERRHEHPPFEREHRVTVDFCQDLDVRACFPAPGPRDKPPGDRLLPAGRLESRLKAPPRGPERLAPDDQID